MKTLNKSVAIIGAGACGLWTANAIKRGDPSIEVTIFERFDIPGKKILMSGNSKGNLTNLGANPANYNQPEFVKSALAYSPGALLERFKDLGIQIEKDEQGRVYPYSMSSQSVVDLFVLDNTARGVKTLYKTNVDQIEFDKTTSQFKINNTSFDYVVIATGSNAGLGPKVPKWSFPKLTSSKIHTFTESFPSLSSVGVKENIESLYGLRQKAGLSIEIDGKVLYSTLGEVQFIKNSLSGIAIFELSSFYARAKVKGKVNISRVFVDLIPEVSEKDLTNSLEISLKATPYRDDATLLFGYLNPTISKFVLTTLKKDKIKSSDIPILAKTLKNLIFNVDLNYLPLNNQVVCGGINTEEVNALTLESKLIPNLFIGGEVLDVDGLCGGYNLHFAFVSGELIANTIVKKGHK